MTKDHKTKHDEPKEVQPRDFIIDAQSPYFLHPSDLLGAIIVTVRFNGKKLRPMKQVIRKSLKAKNKLGFIDGTISKPKVSKWNAFNYSHCMGDG